MKIVHVVRLLERGPFPESADWHDIESHLLSCMSALEWPAGAGKFILYDQHGKKRGEGSGVKPIKDGFIVCLQRHGWLAPHSLDIATTKRPGPVDAAHPVGDQYFALEWETGNISSSHRSMNKMVLGMLKGALIGGALILPTREMYRYLTDRVGNYEELEPYFDVWRSIEVQNGLLMVVAIEHDSVSRDVPRFPKGTDGRALA
jgi:hypothetical protein